VAAAVGLYLAYRRWKAVRIDRQIIDLEVEEAELALTDDALEPVGGDEDDEEV